VRQVITNRMNDFRRRTGFQWGGGEIIVAGILIFGILSMGSGMFSKWLRASREGGLLMVDLHSFSSANYGVDEMPISVPAIGLEIIQDLLGIKVPPDTGRPGSIALVTPTPTPTLPFTGALPSTSTPGAGVPDESNPTDQPKNTATPMVNRTQTSTPTSQLPVETNPPQEPSATLQPIASPTSGPAASTPQPTLPPPTSTPQPSPVPPTSTPPTSPTPQPADSATPRPTRSSTQAVTPTAVYTPVVSPGPPVIP
jgi:hypothetical protein